MYTNTLSKFGLFGKIGKVIMTALSVIAALITVSCCILTAFIAILPEDALSVRVDEHTELHFGTETFGTLWNILGGSFTYSGGDSPESMLESNGNHITPPKNQEIQTELKLFNRSYGSAKIRSEGGRKIMEAEASPAEYNAKNLITVFACITLFAASAAVSLWMLRNLFSVLKKCESPFCGDVVRKMSLNELSARVGVANVNLSKIKNGHISAIRFSTLAAICDVLQCQPGDILKYNPEENKTEGLKSARKQCMFRKNLIRWNAHNKQISRPPMGIRWGPAAANAPKTTLIIAISKRFFMK